MTNEEYNKWLILYFDMQSINLQFNCNDQEQKHTMIEPVEDLGIGT